jgi:hypothetical protein
MNPASLVDEKVDHLESLVQDEINGNEQIEEPSLSSPEKVIQVNNVVSVPKTKILFWSENPNVLLDPKHAFEFFPTETMSFNQKLNALTRIVLILTLISYIFTQKPRILIISLVSLLCIFLLHYSTIQKSSEGFQEGDNGFRKFYNRNGPFVEVDIQKNEYQESEPSNPLSNVMLTDYDYNPNKKPAPPSYTEKDKDIILEETKKQIQLLNPDQPDIDKKLYHDVTDNLDFEQSMRQFYSTANTTIPNDQQGFAEFCYGDMISAKEGNMFAAVRNNPRYTNH